MASHAKEASFGLPSLELDLSYIRIMNHLSCRSSLSYKPDPNMVRKLRIENTIRIWWEVLYKFLSWIQAQSSL